jgi:hypothetical protein
MGFMWRGVMCCSLLLAACFSEDRRPTVPDFDGGLRRDAAVDPPDGPPDAPPDAPPVKITGSVCLLTDLRDLASCDPIGPGQLEIVLGSKTTTSAAGTGAFSIELDAAATHWTVRDPGGGARVSLVTFDPTKLTGVSLPIIADARYDALIAANGIVEAKAEGAAVMFHLRAGNPLPGVVLTGGGTVRYDGTDAVIWDTDATGARGMAWVTNLAAGSVVLRSDISVGMDRDTELSIEADAITYHVVDDL